MKNFYKSFSNRIDGNARFQKETLMRLFVRSLSTRCPFSVEFIYLNRVEITFVNNNESYFLQLSIDEFRELMIYGIDHINYIY